LVSALVQFSMSADTKLDSLLLSADSCSPIPPATDCN
jgi:hypothetical protein